MQPYFLPYIGYWQLVASADRLVILDDVNYIKRGWIARNRIACQGSLKWLILPLQKASQNKLICEIDLAADEGWQARIHKTIQHAYGRAPYFKLTYELFASFMHEAVGNLSQFLSKTIAKVARHLQIDTEIIATSRYFSKQNLRGQQRIIDICKKLKATEYVNLPGGSSIYDKQAFHAANIDLQFIQLEPAYASLVSGATGKLHLSILDTLMHNDLGNLSMLISKRSNLTSKEA